MMSGNSLILCDCDNFRVIRATHLGKLTYHITWKSNPIKSSAFIDIAQWVRNSRDYSPISPKTIKLVSNYTHNINKKYDISMTTDQSLAIRNIVIKDKIIRGYQRMNANIEKMAMGYNSGTDIIELSMKYDFPPLNLLRGVFIYNRLPVKQIYNIFANKENPAQLLSERDLQQYQTADKNDAESTINQRTIAKLANENELAVTEFFRSLGINLLDQDQLTKEQKDLHGRAVITPDILFVDRVMINGVHIKWIDYKDYVGTPIKFLRDSNAAQAAKYKAKWGLGALCFHRSFVDELTLPGSILLDARVLPIKLKK